MERRITGGALVVLALCLLWFVALHWSWYGETGVAVLLSVYVAVLGVLGAGVASGNVGFDESVAWKYESLILYATVVIVVLLVGLTFLTLAPPVA